MHDKIFANFAKHVLLNSEETARISGALQQKTVAKNDKLLEQGHICRNIYFVNSGCLRIFNLDKNGLEHNIMFCPENWWAADIASFSGQSAAFYNISALETAGVIYLSYAALEQLYNDVPRLERFFRILVQNGMTLYQRRINSIISKTAEERYAQFRQLYPHLEQRIAQKHIASYLGITPVFLSMIRAKKK